MPRQKSDEPYAAQWSVLATGSVVFGLANAIQASADTRAFAIGIQVVTLAFTFVAGFCYRERLRQMNREPRWRIFRRTLR